MPVKALDLFQFLIALALEFLSHFPSNEEPEQDYFQMPIKKTLDLEPMP